ncbi:MAG: hypothetical protein J7525_19690 [Roseofilum sp. SID3]|uniref:hypothetical protein n=1 Tax=Roseofilum sp. SID3 TaxID=2821499 RepID=UPI001B29CF29|nr:hypothetical protein [Roseofilum sp. SID3]MBP0015319.1 hypothetical protein [Roseofilum sp. SID3]
MTEINNENVEWRNVVLATGGSRGYLTSVATWKVWSCPGKAWKEDPPVVLRNILLASLHPNIRYAIGEVAKTETNPALLAPFKTESTQYSLDLASGSRNHGRFTFSSKELGPFYYGTSVEDQWKRIIYGSIVHTGCKNLVYQEMTYIVIDDEVDETDPEGYQTGDSHAKCSQALMNFLRENLHSELQGVSNPNRPVQFRAALPNRWVAKGTIAYNPKLDNEPAELVIPKSCFKGNKPGLGNHTGKLLIGIVFEAEQRRAKPGWMFWQWFSFETLEKDGIISKMQEKCNELSAAVTNIQLLSELLRIDEEESQEEVNDDDGVTTEVEYVNNMVKIIQSDKNGLLLGHPWLMSRIKSRLREIWLNLAKAAGVRFHSVMTQPDESLAHYHKVLPDGSIEGEKVFCAPDYSEGMYIMFINPMRHWGDTQIWENKHEGTYANSTGVLAAPRLLLLSLGRDTDGDFVQMIQAEKYFHMTRAIANFSDAPVTQKFPKMALSGNLQQIALRSMNDMTGIVASLLGRARAANAENIVLEIPPGGEQTEAIEMRIIDFLSQQLQIAVDSLKSAYPNNVNGLNAVGKFLNDQNAEAPWLKGFKDPEVYISKPCPVNPSATDTVSRLVKVVNANWVAMADTGKRADEFQEVLYNTEAGIDFDNNQLNIANKHRLNYGQEIRAAIAWKNAHDGDSTKIRQVVEKYRQLKQEILDIPDSTGDPYPPQSWAAAFWFTSHKTREGTAGCVFTMFTDEICEMLLEHKPEETKVITCYGCQYGQWAAPKDSPLWNGQLVNIKVVSTTQRGKTYMGIDMEWPDARNQKGYHYLGIISGAIALPQGAMRPMKIFSTAWKNGVTSGIMLFDPSMRMEEIYTLLARGNRTNQ